MKSFSTHGQAQPGNQLAEKISELENMIKMKDIEIQSLEQIISESRIMQCDGGDFDEFLDESEQETDEESQIEYDEIFSCDLCDSCWKAPQESTSRLWSQSSKL